MQVGLNSQAQAAALYVALLHDGHNALADEFFQWWTSRTQAPLNVSGWAGVSEQWDADELGLDEDELC